MATWKNDIFGLIVGAQCCEATGKLITGSGQDLLTLNLPSNMASSLLLRRSEKRQILNVLPRRSPTLIPSKPNDVYKVLLSPTRRDVAQRPTGLNRRTTYT